jgi:hypothetical protein
MNRWYFAFSVVPVSDTAWIRDTARILPDTYPTYMLIFKLKNKKITYTWGIIKGYSSDTQGYLSQPPSTQLISFHSTPTPLNDGDRRVFFLLLLSPLDIFIHDSTYHGFWSLNSFLVRSDKQWLVLVCFHQTYLRLGALARACTTVRTTGNVAQL